MAKYSCRRLNLLMTVMDSVLISKLEALILEDDIIISLESMVHYGNNFVRYLFANYYHVCA